MNLDVGIAKEVLLGDLKSSNISFVDIDMSAFKTHTNTLIGVIGGSVINKYNWDFHFDKNYVVVSTKPFKEVGQTLDLSTDKAGGYYFNLIINSKPVKFNIDFGDNTKKIRMPKNNLSLLQNYKISDTAFELYGMSVGGLGNTDSSFTIKNVSCGFEIGGIKNFTQNIIFSANPVYRVGNSFFREFNCIINAASKNKNIILYNRKIDTVNKNYSHRIGIAILNDTLRIVNIHHVNAPIEGNIKLMDAVSSINGHDKKYFLSNLDLIEYQNNISEKHEPLIIKMMNGNEFTFNPQIN